MKPPIQKAGTTYYSTVKDVSSRELTTVEIGDSKEPSTFIPQVKVLKWDNECNFSMRFVGDKNDKIDYVGTDSIDSEGKIKYPNHGDVYEFFHLENSNDIPEGAFEFNVVLHKKPKKHTLDFSLKFKNVSFHKQTSFKDQIGTEGIVSATDLEGYDADGNIIAFMNENVLNSYAVYCDSPIINIKDKTLYRCGKIGHIYRPLITDYNGFSVFGELILDPVTEILTVEIPQDFLDGAVYPVIVDPTFGYTTGGSLSQTVSTAKANIRANNILVLGATDSPCKATAFTMWGSAVSPGNTIRGGAYTLPSGASTTPVSRVDITNGFIVGDTYGWWDSGTQLIDLPISLPANQTYCAAMGQSSPALGINRTYDTMTGEALNGRSEHVNDTLASTWNETNQTKSNFSFYITYESLSSQTIALTYDD